VQKNTRLHSSAESCPENMVACLPKSRIASKTAGKSWRCGSVLNPLNEVFSARICYFDPGNQILSQKLLVNVSIETSAGWPLVA
jgi:hypothetical protein